MDAILIFKRKFSVRCKSGLTVTVYMDLFRLPDGYPDSFPEGYRFSWIAFEAENELARVLFDCHADKAPHIHINGDEQERPYQWESLDAAYEMFFQKVQERFGEFEEE